MAAYKIRHTQSSESDLLGIIRYIANELQEPAIASRMAESIDKAIESLSDTPHRYAFVDDERLAAMGYRKLHIKNYIAFFTIDEKDNVVHIERILYARRDWLHIL